MNCPACGNELTQITVDTFEADVCRGGCGGIWFDNFEIKKFDEEQENAQELLNGIRKDPLAKVDHTRRYKCPKCDDLVMMRHFFSIKHKVEVDECPGCGGVWLDYGELGQIRDLYKTEAEREQAAKDYFSEVLGKEFEQMKAESDEKLVRARRFANVFRFICPTAYIPGKQDWGAF